MHKIKIDPKLMDYKEVGIPEPYFTICFILMVLFFCLLFYIKYRG